MESRKTGLTPQGAVAAIGEAFGVGLRPAQYMARLLREDRSGLWPEIGTGRRALINVPDMVNLMVGLACAEGRPRSGPRMVKQFRNLASAMSTLRRRDGGAVKVSEAFRPVPDLGSWLDGLVDSLIHDDQPADKWFDAKALRPEVRIMLTEPITAEITLPDPDDAEVYDRVRFSTLNGPLGLEVTPVQPSKLHRHEVVFGMLEIQALASIARAAEASADDLLSTETSQSPGRDEGVATPEATKPAGTGIHDGLQNERPAPKAQTAVPHKTQFATSKGSKQRLRAAVEPRSQDVHSSEPKRARNRDTHRIDQTST